MDPNNLSFVLTVHREPRWMIGRCLAFLRRAHPTAPVVMVSDGSTEPRVPELASAFGATYVAGQHLKRAVCGGQWWERTFREGIALGRSHFVKLDADTVIWRPFETLPAIADCTGNVLPNDGNGVEHVQGGFQIIATDFAQRALDASVGEWPELRTARTWGFARRMDEFLRTGYLSTDLTLMYILKRLGGTWSQHSEIMSLWASAVVRPAPQWAVTHPHKSRLC